MSKCVLLFDFDGLLVNTEPLHYRAYMRMCEDRGFALQWDFAKFCHEAHSQEGGFFAGLRKEMPHAFDHVTTAMLYAEKTQWYNRLLGTEPLDLMPGVETVLVELQKRDIARAIVTNSARGQVETVAARLPLLATIPLWITREDYRAAKPSPEGYLLAMERLGARGGPAIGFEDTLKGVQALQSAGAVAVLVSPADYSGVAVCKRLGAQHWEQMSWELVRSGIENFDKK
jgi:HAD superfamily hydrolase (TIGR01509 family)